MSSLAGIEYFTALKELYCMRNSLTELDLSNNPELVNLYCAFNNLTELDLSNNPELMMVVCYNNNLTELDLSVNPKLTDVSCSNNRLTLPTLSNCSDLLGMDCSNNALTELNLPNMPRLDMMFCNGNLLSELDLSGLPNLHQLQCHDNELSELNISSNTELVILSCYGNSITELDLSACPYLLEAVRSGSVTEEERYIKYESANRALSVDPTTQLITGEESAYSVTVTDYTKGAAQTSLDLAGYYSGDVLFSVASKNDTPVLVAVKDGDEYTVLPCTTDENGAHSYWLSVDRNIEIVLVFKGDADLNGSVTATDGNRVKRAVVGTYSFANELSRLAADVNSDGLIQARDGHMIQRFAIGTYVISW